MEPNLGVKSFADFILLTSQSIYLPYYGVLLDRAHNSCKGFVFRAISRTGNCSSGRKHCSHCASKINTVPRKIRNSLEPAFECARRWATILNISWNPDLAEMKIHTIRVENRNLCHQLARVVLLRAMEKDGAVFPDGVAGNQIKQAVRIMDGSISNTL
jgi:hypothetical protein